MKRREYKPENYWQERLSKNFSLSGVGHSSLGLEYNKWLYKARIRTLERLLRVHKLDSAGKRILDLGCGNGFYIGYWKRLGAAAIVGLDITEVSISSLTERYPEYSFLQEDITGEELQLEEKFDIITAFDVLFHIVDEDKFEQAIRNIRRMAHQDTRILIMDSFLSQPHPPGFHENYRSLERYRQVLLGNGLEVVDIKPIFYFMNTPVDLDAVKSKLRRGILSQSWNIVMRLIALGKRAHLPGQLMNNLLGDFLYCLDGIVLKYAKDSPGTKLLLVQLEE